jgi:hypothetical protein
MKINKTVIYCLIIFLFTMHTCFAQSKNKKAKTGVTAKYELAGPFYNGLARVMVKQKWGYIDTTGNVIVKPKYNQVENFSNGMARVRLGQKWGLIDLSGNEIIKPTFNFIGEFINGKAKVLLDGEEYFMNTQGIRVDK